MKIAKTKNLEYTLINKSKGITLVSLVVTIIILLILAGITIATLTGENGLLNRAGEAKIENEKAEEKEQINLAIMASKVNEQGSIDRKVLREELLKIEGLTGVPEETQSLPWQVTGKTGIRYEINNERANILEEDEQETEKQNSELITKATINIKSISSRDLRLTVDILENEKENVAGYYVFANGKVKRVVEENEIQVKGLDENTTYTIGAVVIDKDGKIRKSNEENITTTNGDYIYKEGIKYTELTGGWEFFTQAYSSIEETDTKRIYAKRWGGSNGGWSISTSKAVNISGYTKLCCKYTASSNEWDNDGLRLRINNTKCDTPGGGSNNATYNSECFEYDKTDNIFEWDISQIPEGTYYIGIGGSAASNTYIDEIWFE